MRWAERLEPLWWMLFGAGGTMAALLIPAHVFVNNIAVPLGWMPAETTSYDTMARLLDNLLVKLYLIVLLGGTILHALHRFTFLPGELLSPPSRHTLAPFAYVTALLLTAAAVVIVIVAP